MNKRGVLLINLGTPDAPTPAAIRAFLRQFLSDRRVVDLPRALWLPILYGFILPFRPGRLAEAYKKIWTAEGSPLLAKSKRLTDTLRARLKMPMALGMCYGSPSLTDAVNQLRAEGVQEMLVLPLYPQFSHTTTSAALDALPRVETCGIIDSYHANSGYIAALKTSVQEHWHKKGRGDHLLMSFHGIPQRYVDAGDPYEKECRETARLLAEALNLRENQWTLGFQSRLGRAPWLKPYTDVLLPQFAQRGIKKLDVICPGFATDCLETLEEVAIRYAEDFREAGGAELRYIPALNDHPKHVEALSTLINICISA